METKKKSVGFNLLPLLALATFLTACLPPGPKALVDGQRLLAAGNSAAAIERLEVASRLLATNANVWNYLGLAYHHAGRASNAVAAYQRALAEDHDLVETRFNLGSLWLDLGRPAEAKAEFTAYSLRRPNAPEGFQKLATAELRGREVTLAETHVRRALQLDAASAEAWNTLGLVQLQRSRTRDAAQSFGEALKKQPRFAPALLNLAIVSQQLGDRATALKLYRQYLDLTPPPVNAESVAALVQQLELDLSPARPAVVPVVVAPNLSVKTSPPPALVAPVVPVAPVAPVVSHSGASNVAVAKGAPPIVKTVPAPLVPAPAPRVAPTVVTLPPEPAIRVTPEVAPLVSSSPPVASPPSAAMSQKPFPLPEAQPSRSFLQSINPVNLFRRANKSPKVTAASRAEVLIEPAIPAAPAPARAVVGVPDETVSRPAIPSTASFVRYKYQGGISIAPGDRTVAERFAAQGAEAMSRKRYPEAAAFYHSAAGADPSWFQAPFNEAIAALEIGRVPEALAAGEAALTVKPDSPEARYNFALALKRGNYILDAAAQLEKLLTANPADAQVHLMLGNIYAEQLRQPDLARARYLKVLELAPRHPQATNIRFWLKAHPPL